MAGGSWLDAFLGKIASAGTYLDLGAGINFGAGLSASLNPSTKLVDVDVASDSIAPAALAPESAGVGTSFTIHKAFAAGGAAGTADDVTIYLDNAPFAFRIIRAYLIVSTAVGGSTARLRNQSGGTGTAVSALFDTDVATDDPDRSAPLTSFPTIAAGGSLHLRRSDRAVAGSIAILCVRV